jgi:olefin beta-lactone synthetase
MNYNISQTLSDRAREMPERTGLISKKISGYGYWSFQQLYENTNCYANALTRVGVKKGDRVILMVAPSMEFVCLTFALFKMGAVIILVDPGMGYRNLTKCINSVQPDVFIGIPKAHFFRKCFSSSFKTVRLNICVGLSLGFLGISFNKSIKKEETHFVQCETSKDDLAAIIFTTGSTGPPKGVQYTHSIFSAQLALIEKYYGISKDDIDQPAFPLFALFSIALGACAVIPEMNPARPAQVDPEKFITTIRDHKVSYSFGSPAIWNVVSAYCIKNKIILPIKKILMAGAPVSGELIQRVKKIMPPDGEVHTPYGATESLPVSSMTGSEIIEETWPETRKGKGTCVGRPLPGIDIQVISPSEDAIVRWSDVNVLQEGEIGEIVVKGSVVTKAYDHNDSENKISKIEDGRDFWHRIGDMGYLDNQGRLWFCGRKTHRVKAAKETMYTIPCEAIFNEHPDVLRSALVGIGKSPHQQPVIIVELKDKKGDTSQIVKQLRVLAKGSNLTENITNFLIHPLFPVDIRHNAKIFREKLSVWATEQLSRI